mgnify:CR=1 FL=1
MESLKFTKGKLLMICLAVFAIAVIAITVFKVSMESLFFFAIILACPLMHIFMMKSHGGHEEKDDTKGNGKSCH